MIKVWPAPAASEGHHGFLLEQMVQSLVPDHATALRLALLELKAGVRETPGPGNTRRVQEYIASCTNRDIAHELDETPWCAAFVNWCLEQAGIVGNHGCRGTNSLAARSYQNWGVRLTDVPGNTGPQPGDICVFSRGNNPAHGHVGFFIAALPGPDGKLNIWVLGGNQGDALSIAPYPADRLLDIRRAV